MDLSTVGTAMEIVSKAWKALEAVRERAQASKDVTLKSNVGELYDDFNSMRSVIVRLTDEIADLNRQILQLTERPPKPAIRQEGETNYYYVGEDGPFCQPCYDREEKLRMLTPRQSYVGGTGRKCQTCGALFLEARARASRAQVKGYWE
jgi:hypothetical protein